MHNSFRSFLPIGSAVFLFLAACGTAGNQSTISTDPPASGPSQPTDIAAARAQAQSDLILGGGGGATQETVDSAHPLPLVVDAGTAWTQPTSLPAVNTAYSFALAANDTDSTGRLGFMFYDPSYRATLEAQA